MALTIRIGFWGILYYNTSKEPQNSNSNYLGSYSRFGAPDFILGFRVSSDLGADTCSNYTCV